MIDKQNDDGGPAADKTPSRFWRRVACLVRGHIERWPEAYCPECGTYLVGFYRVRKPKLIEPQYTMLDAHREYARMVDRDRRRREATDGE